MKFFILLIVFINQALYAQDTGPVYNFNFYNKEVNLPGSNPIKQNNTTGETPSQIKNQSKTEASLKSIKNYFERSPLNPEDRFIGLGLSYLQPIERIDGQAYYRMFSANILLPSLFGLKVIRDQSKQDNIYLINNEAYPYGFVDTESTKVGINKFIPFNDHIAVELGAFYEFGEIHYDTGIGDSGDSKFKAGSALAGLSFFSGNFVAGITYQQRLMFKAKNELNTYINDIKTRGIFAANVGLFF